MLSCNNERRRKKNHQTQPGQTGLIKKDRQKRKNTYIFVEMADSVEGGAVEMATAEDEGLVTQESRPLQSEDEVGESEGDSAAQVPTGAKPVAKNELGVASSKSGSVAASEHSSSSHAAGHVKRIKLAEWYIRYPCRSILIILAIFIFVVFIDSLEFELISNTELSPELSNQQQQRRQQ